jgi:hypothetical protein
MRSYHRPWQVSSKYTNYAVITAVKIGSSNLGVERWGNKSSPSGSVTKLPGSGKKKVIQRRFP